MGNVIMDALESMVVAALDVGSASNNADYWRGYCDAIIDGINAGGISWHIEYVSDANANRIPDKLVDEGGIVMWRRNHEETRYKRM